MCEHEIGLGKSHVLHSSAFAMLYSLAVLEVAGFTRIQTCEPGSDEPKRIFDGTHHLHWCVSPLCLSCYPSPLLALRCFGCCVMAGQPMEQVRLCSWHTGEWVCCIAAPLFEHPM